MRTLAFALLLIGTTAAAQDERTGPMLGIGGGQANYDIDALGFSDETGAWKAMVGWRFHPALTLEVAYIDGGSVSGEFGPVSVSVEGEVVQASITGGWWFNDAFGAYARAGANYYDAELHASGPGGSITVRDDGTEFGWGAGLQAIWDRALWRLEYESIEFEDVDVTLISLSIIWQF